MKRLCLVYALCVWCGWAKMGAWWGSLSAFKECPNGFGNGLNNHNKCWCVATCAHSSFKFGLEAYFWKPAFYSIPPFYRETHETLLTWRERLKSLALSRLRVWRGYHAWIYHMDLKTRPKSLTTYMHYCIHANAACPTFTHPSVCGHKLSGQWPCLSNQPSYNTVACV